MAVLDVVIYPDDPLTKKALPFDIIGPDVAQLAHDMLETMHTYSGVGLAGPQVGVSKQIIVMQEPEKSPLCLVNPVLADFEGREEDEEGCLSLPYLFAMVPRATSIRVRAFDERGKPLDFVACDFLARVIQHEYDHLMGVVFLDRLDILSREDKLREWQEIRAKLKEGGMVGGDPAASVRHVG